MPARNGFRRRSKIIPVVALATVALTAASAAAQAPGLPRTYNVTRIDTPEPVGGGAFGWGIYSADLTGDGKQDLLVAQGQADTGSRPSTIAAPQAKVFIFDGATGDPVDAIDPPESNPLEPQLQPAPPAAPVPPVYRAPEMAFVYIETMPDIGSCAGGDGPDPDKICDLPIIGAKDGIPEILVGSRNLRVNATNGALPPEFDDPNDPNDAPSDPLIGRGYVLDGATRAVLKRIDMPPVDRAAVLARSGRNSSPAFGRTMASPQGMPPCAGLASENNDTGVGACPAITRGFADTTLGSNTLTNVDIPKARNGDMIVGAGLPPGSRIVSGAGTTSLVVSTPPTSTALPNGAGATATATHVAFTVTDPRYSQAVRIGDLDGGGEPDIVITARGFPETRGPTGSAAASSECRLNTTAGGNCSAGKTWTYRGEAIVGTSPQTILDTPLHSIQNPDAQTTGGEYGGNLFRVGDIAGIQNNDGFPDFVIPFRGADLPLKAPDLQGYGFNAGAAHLFNGFTGSLASGGRTLISPEPQQRSQFSGNFNAGRAVGDLGATDTADILLPAPMHNALSTDDGKLWVFNGDTGPGGGGEGSWQFATLTDPEPYIGGNFGGGMTGVGNIVGGRQNPANEVLVGGFRFDNFTEASQNVVPDVNFMNATTQQNLMTIPHPTGARGDGFGIGITPMGDLNDDGFLDFAVSAYLANGPEPGNGRAWIFKSDNSPLPPAPEAPAPIASGPVTPASESKQLQPGRCVNQTIGTDAGELLKGTLAGDAIFGFAGADTLMGYQGQDCLDGGTGNDTLSGGDDNDRAIGGPGKDRLDGDDGRDDLFGGASNDRLDGRYGRDMLAGGANNDRLYGGPDADELFGEGGKDRLVGGRGRNLIDGGTGNDSIDARNGERDRVICGAGRDKVRADRNDRLNGCEAVTYGGKIR